MSRSYKILRKRKGQAMVEFVLIFLIVIMIALGIAQFSMILSAQIAVTNAAREGARHAAVGAKQETEVSFELDGQIITLPSVRAVVSNAISGHPFLTTTGLNVIVSGVTQGEPVTVTITGVNVRTIVPVPSFNNFSPGAANIVNANVPFPLTATASMRLERK